jgi:LPS sulfotransferase NodH/4-hydroxybenzoate polyprenyltransferase
LPDVSEVIRGAWETGRAFDLTGIGYGRIHWDNEQDISSTPFSYYFFLAGLVRLTGAKRILEIGTHCGGSIRAMQAGLSSTDGAVLVTVDVSRESDAYLTDTSIIRKVVGDANSAETFATIRKYFEDGCDLLYIDARHDFWPTYLNYALYVTALRPAMVVLDDITLNQDMEHFWGLVQRSVPPGRSIDATEIEPSIRPAGSARPGFGVIIPDPDPATTTRLKEPHPLVPASVPAENGHREQPQGGVQDLGARISGVLRTVRAAEWWGPKLSPLLAIAYLEISVGHVPPATAYPALAALVVGLAFMAAYGHAINDLFDIASDRAAGKANGMAPLSPWQRGLVLLTLVVGAALPWLAVPPARAALWAWAGIYTLLTAYSTPPVRFKERGFAGVVTDAAMAHAVPTLFVGLFFTGLARTPGRQGPALLATAVAWAATVGLRNILLGQIWDYENDIRSGTVTFTVDIGPARARRFVRGLFVSELGTLALLVTTASPALPWLAPAVALAVAFDLWKVRVRSEGAYDPAPDAGQCVPLHDLYQVWLPVMLSVGLTLHDWRLGLIPVFHLALFQDDIRGRAVVADIRGGSSVVGSLIRRLLRRTDPFRRRNAPPAPMLSASGLRMSRPPQTCYVICATRRSGSNLLCDALGSLGVLGRPTEYFMSWSVVNRNSWRGDSELLEGSRLPVDAYLRRIVELGSTTNGVFGVKIMWDHLDLTIAKLREFETLVDLPAHHVLSGLWPHLKYVYMTRRDKVRQAVSLAKAQQSGIWVELDDSALSDAARVIMRAMGERPRASHESAGSSSPGNGAGHRPDIAAGLRYDFAQLAKLYRELQEQDEAWHAYFCAAGVKPFRVFYEDLVGHEHETAIQVARYLGVQGAEHAPVGKRTIRRQSDATNDAWARRFAEEMAGLGAQRAEASTLEAHSTPAAAQL